MLTRITPQKQQSKGFRFAQNYIKLILFSLFVSFNFFQQAFANNPLPDHHLRIKDAVYWNGTWYLCDGNGEKQVILNNLMLANPDPGIGGFPYCGNPGSSPYFTYCLANIPTSITIPSALPNTPPQPNIAPGPNPKFTFISTESTNGIFKIALANFQGSITRPMWFDLATGNLVDIESLSARVGQLTDAETIVESKRWPCDYGRPFELFESVEPLEDEIWEYTTNAGGNWTTVTPTSHFVKIRNLGSYYEIYTDAPYLSSFSQGTFELRARLPISLVDEDNDQSCRTSDVIIKRIKYDMWNFRARIEGPERACVGSRVSINVIENSAGNGVPSTAWTISGPDLQNSGVSAISYNYNGASFIPTLPGVYRIRLTANCGPFQFTEIEVIVNEPVQVSYNISTDGPVCYGSSITINAENVCNALWYDMETGALLYEGLTYSFTGFEPINIRLVGIDCSGCTTRVEPISIDIYKTNSLELRPVCDESDPYAIGMFDIKTGEEFEFLKEPSKLITIEYYDDDKKIWIRKIIDCLTKKRIGSRGGWNFRAIIRNIRECLGIPRSIRKFRWIVSSPEDNICQTFEFNIFNERVYTGDGSITFEGLTFVQGFTDFRTSSIGTTKLDVIVEKNAKLYFMHETPLTDAINARSYAPTNTNGMQWTLFDGAFLTVKPGATLTSECKMWLGIDVTSGASKYDFRYLKVGERNAPQVLISNALVALRARNTNSTNDGMTMKIVNTSFFNNMTGFICDVGNFIDGSDLERVSAIHSNLFDSDPETMLIPFHPQMVQYDQNGNSEFMKFVSANHLINSARTSDTRLIGPAGIIYFDGTNGPSNNEIHTQTFKDNTFKNCLEGVVSFARLIGTGPNGNGATAMHNPGITLKSDVNVAHGNSFINCYKVALGTRTFFDGTYATDFSSNYLATTSASYIGDLTLQLPSVADIEPGIFSYKKLLPNPLGLSILSDPNDENVMGIYSTNQKLVVENVSFQGTVTPEDFTGKTVGIYGIPLMANPTNQADNNSAPFRNCSFFNLDYGISVFDNRRFSQPGLRCFSIQGNYFNHCAVGINIDKITEGDAPSSTLASIKCNEFVISENDGQNYTGILVSNRANQFREINFDFAPGANVFPLRSDINRTFLPTNPNNGLPLSDVEAIASNWASPTNWKSIKSLSNSVIRYHRYSNEFLGNLDFLIPNGILLTRSPNLITYNWIFANSSTTDNFVHDCEFSLYTVNFPITLVSQSQNPSQSHTPSKSVSEQSLINLINASANEIKVVLVRDILGRSVKQFTVDEIRSISLESLKTGIYFVTLVKNNGTTETFKSYSK